MPRIFISHSSKNVQESNRIKEWLDKNGFDLSFLDYNKQSGIPVGKDWERVLYDEIERSQAVIIILTPDWQASKWCFSEYTQARALGKAIYPLQFEACEDKQISGSIQHLDLTSNSSGAYEHLLKELTTLALNTQEGFEWDRNRSPYPGMLSFDEEDAAIFFGRDDDTLRVIERLNARRTQGGSRLLALLGASGSGKSSLLKAGVLPRLRRDKRHWIILPIFRPKLRPVREFAIVLATILDKMEEVTHYYQKLMKEDASDFLSKIADQIQQQAIQFDATILISVDQSEELFSTSDPKETECFFKIISLLKYKESPWLCIFTLRSDFLGYLQNTEALKTDFTEISLKPMPLSRIDSIIRGPAKVVGLKIDPELIAVATEDAKTKDALPLLAFALRQLYERFGDDGDLTLDEYKRLGNDKEKLHPLENAVRKAADDAIKPDKTKTQLLQALRQAFIPYMVRVNDQGEYVKRTAKWEDLPEKAYPLLEQLAKARLLTIKQSNSDKTIEVSHEALLRKWPLLQTWLQEMHEFLVGKEQLKHSLRDWQNSNEKYKEKALLQGLQLYRAKKWFQKHPNQLSKSETEYIKKSSDLEKRLEKQKQRNIKIFATVVTVLAILAFVLLFFQIKAKKETTQQLVLNLMQQAIDARDNNNEYAKAKLLFAKAEELSTTQHQKENANHASHRINHGRLLNIFEQDSPVKGLVMSPENNWFISWGEDNYLRLWKSFKHHKPNKLLSHKEDIRGAIISPKGDRVLSWGNDFKLRLWDVSTEKEISTFEHEDKINGAVFSEDAGKILSWSDDKTIKIWNIKKNKIDHQYNNKNIVNSAIFIDNERYIISSEIGNNITIWKTDQKKPVRLIYQDKQVLGIIPINNGKDVITWSSDHSIKIISIETEKTRKIFTSTSSINQVIVSKYGSKLISMHTNGEINLWDIATEKKILQLSHKDDVIGAAFTDNEKKIISWSKDKTVRVWDIASKSEIAQMTHGAVINGAIFRDNKILSWSGDKSIRYWEVETQLYLHSLSHKEKVFGVQYFDKKDKIVSWSGGKLLTVWDINSGKIISESSTPKNDKTWKVSFSREKDKYLSWGKNHELYETEIATGKSLLTEKKEMYIKGARYLPNSNDFVSWHHETSKNGSIYFWGNNNGILNVKYKCTSPYKVNGINFISENDYLLVWSGGYTTGGSVDIIDCKNNKLIKSFYNEKKVNGALLLNENNILIMWGDDKNITIWDVDRDKLLKTLPHNSQVNGVIKTKSNDKIASWSDDGILRVWSIKNYNLLKEMHHSEKVNGAIFTNDDSTIISWSNDKTIRIWDSITGFELQRLVHSYKVRNVLVDEEQKFLVSSGSNNSVNIWCYIPDPDNSKRSLILNTIIDTGTTLSSTGVVKVLTAEEWFTYKNKLKIKNNKQDVYKTCKKNI